MKTIYFFLLAAGLLTACNGGGGSKVAPVSERIQKTWSAQIVKENNTTVFSRGSTNNTRPGYSSFRLELSGNNVARLTEFEGTLFTGTWSVSADEKTLTLTGLTPQPSGTNGTIPFTINALTDGSLTINRTTTSLKTGNTINDYQLVNP